MAVSLSEKVQQYETFLNDNLKGDLKFLEQKLKEINLNLSGWCLLKKVVTDIKEYHPRGFKMQSNFGCGILTQVNVADPSVIKINVGLDVYLEMALDEAEKYCDMRINLKNKEVHHIQHQANKIKAHIKIVLLGLQELQNI